MSNLIEHIIAVYDGGSRRPGSSNSLNAWAKILRNSKKQIIQRELSNFVPYIAENKIKNCHANKVIPILIGGDHSLTYFACKALTSIYGPLNIVVFDAHHDSYQHNYLNHYTVFYYCKKNLRSNIHLIGCRKDGYTEAEQDLKNVNYPCYISVDVDYFSPKLVPSVMDPVLCIENNLCTFETYKNTLNSIPKNVIIGADLVEWFGNAEDTEEYKFIQNVYLNLIETIQTKAYKNE